MASEHRHPTREPGKGAVIKTRRPRTEHNLVADVAEAEMGKTAEAEVGVGEMVQPQTPPTKTDRKLGAAFRTDGKEVGRSRRDDGLMWMGTSVRTAVRRPQENLGPAIEHPQRGQ